MEIWAVLSFAIAQIMHTDSPNYIKNSVTTVRNVKNYSICPVFGIFLPQRIYYIYSNSNTNVI